MKIKEQRYITHRFSFLPPWLKKKKNILQKNSHTGAHKQKSCYKITAFYLHSDVNASRV